MISKETTANSNLSAIGSTEFKIGENTGFPPLRYSFDPGTNNLIINPYEDEIVREVFRLFLAGKSIGHIFRCMEKTNGNCNCNSTAVRRLLTNQTYAGKVTLGDLCCDGIYEVIISGKDFLSARAMLEHNQEIYKRTYGFNTEKYEVIYMLGIRGLEEDINRCPHYLRDKEGRGTDHTSCGFYRNLETKKEISNQKQPKWFEQYYDR
ncbi:recombinase family protein [Lacrimispora sp.]|uniref:recombinase family protein n=1 Tax=Lacrimispora sp. TaxID=2719234 RepID=UPI0028B23429|nr:recombinase family protein [Lacrimispora sp.]